MSRTHQRYRSPGRIVYIGPELSESDPPSVREMIARRRLLMTTGRCPCGVTLAEAYTRVDAHGITHLTIEHEDGCAAIGGDE